MSPDRVPIYRQVAEYLDTQARELSDNQPSPRLLASILDGILARLDFWSNTLHTLTDVTPRVIRRAQSRAIARAAATRNRRRPPGRDSHAN